MTAGCRGQTGTFHGARYGNPRQPKGDAYCNKYDARSRYIRKYGLPKAISYW